jgi:putative ABC transport system permease protein
VKRALTGLVGAVLEAWQELRIHRTRVLLSLIGVAVAVCSLTTVVALGAIVQQANEELSERSSGRPATLYLSAYSDGTGGGSGEIDGDLMDETWAKTLERYDVRYGSRVASGSQNVAFVDGVVPVGLQAVDQPYGEMHRVRVSEGAWFTPADTEQLAPRLIVNEIFWQRLGSPALETHPTVRLGGQGAQPTTVAVVVGVTPVASYETEPSMFMLVDQYAAVQAADPTGGGAGGGGFVDPFGAGGSPTQYEMWVPPAIAEALIPVLQRDFAAALGEGTQVDVYRQDSAQYGDDPFLVTKLVVGGIAVLVLLLGALGLVNIALVTVKQRVREIGIRRSFGATAGRVFFAVMMESVVATVAAGVAGVVAAVLIVQSPWVRELVGQGMITDFPPFPVDAAVLGLVAATAVGALAGLLPALVAVRVKVIDAIRY